MGLSGHQSAAMKNDEWLTPPEILAKLGRFDLDPCSPINRPWPTAEKHYTVQDNGLNQPWHGRVWCNPPFGKFAVSWLKRMAEHGNGIALIPARTETAMFYETVWGKADGVLFLSRGGPTSILLTANGRISTAVRRSVWWPTARTIWRF